MAVNKIKPSVDRGFEVIQHKIFGYGKKVGLKVLPGIQELLAKPDLNKDLLDNLFGINLSGHYSDGKTFDLVPVFVKKDFEGKRISSPEFFYKFLFSM